MKGPTLQSLTIDRFRNLDHVSYDPNPGLNLLTGSNAQGKTSILEAIYLCSTGRVLRGSRDTNAIQHEAQQSVVRATVDPGNVAIRVTLTHGARKRVAIHETDLPRASDVLGRLPSVCFSSQDLAIVDGEPSDRRAFADAELSQLYPAYFRHFAAYRRALEQRNALLKEAQSTRVDEAHFDVWEQKLADSGEAIRAYRTQWVAELGCHARKIQARLGEGENLQLEWLVDDSGDLLNALPARRHVDILRGSTGIGPHRDELEIRLDSYSAKLHASQGQRRSIIIAIKAAVLETAAEILRSPPVLLLDDVFSDLDQRRRDVLVQIALEQGGQVFITCTEPTFVGKDFLQQAMVMRVQSGRLELL